MFKMKEKLKKNHLKGFDRKVRILAVSSFALLIASLSIFIPLTNNLQTKNIDKIQEINHDKQTTPVVNNNDVNLDY